MGKPIVEDGILENLSEEEARNRGLVDRLNKYIKDIFAKSKAIKPQESTVLAIKNPQQKSKFNKIDDIKIEEYEDQNLNKLLDKEYNV